MGPNTTIKGYTPSDFEMLQLYKKERQQEVLANLFLRYYDMLYMVCVKYLKDQEAAKDAVMSIYETLPQKVQQHSIENFKSWLYVVTRNFCLMELRKNKGHISVEWDGQVMQSQDFSHLDSVLEKEQQLNLMEGCMERLNDEQKRTVRLFYLEQKCYNEICELTGFEWSKVRSLIQNGKRNLKICMEENGTK